MYQIKIHQKTKLVLTTEPQVHEDAMAAYKLLRKAFGLAQGYTVTVTRSSLTSVHLNIYYFAEILDDDGETNLGWGVYKKTDGEPEEIAVFSGPEAYAQALRSVDRLEAAR